MKPTCSCQWSDPASFAVWPVGCRPHRCGSGWGPALPSSSSLEAPLSEVYHFWLGRLTFPSSCAPNPSLCWSAAHIDPSHHSGLDLAHAPWTWCENNGEQRKCLTWKVQYFTAGWKRQQQICQEHKHTFPSPTTPSVTFFRRTRSRSGSRLWPLIIPKMETNDNSLQKGLNSTLILFSSD